MKEISKSQSFIFYVIEYLILLLLGGSIYYGIEVLWRGYSHISMFLVGGICFILIGLLNELCGTDRKRNTPFSIQILIGDIEVLIVEFLAGCYLNLYLGLGIWDYSDLPFNLYGQICLPFAVLWLPIVAFAIVVDDYVRYFLFHGSKPSYTFLLKKKKS